MGIPVQVQAGDVVRLKAGGPPMIVRAVSGDAAYCQWYSETDLHQGTFLLSSLQDISRQRRGMPPEQRGQAGARPDLHA